MVKITDAEKYESSDGVAWSHSKRWKQNEKDKTKEEELFIGRRSAVYEVTLLIRNKANQWVPRVSKHSLQKLPTPINDTLPNKEINIHKKK